MERKLLLRGEGGITLAAHRIGAAAARSLLLLAMQVRNIALPFHDVIHNPKLGAPVPLAQFWEAMRSAGGPKEVGVVVC